MAGREFPRKQTPLAPADTARLLLDSYRKVHGATPDRNTAELYLALLWNENDRGRAVYNYNLGNVIAVGDQDYARPPWWDRAKVEAMAPGSLRDRYLRLNERMTEQPGTVPTKFRAFATAEQGADRWIQTLAGSRYSKTREAAKQGDALEFGRQLHFEGYIADPGTEKLGQKYASLREDVRKAGWFAALPAPEETSPAVVLRAGERYRLTEATYHQPDWQKLRAEMLAAGATDFAHWDDGQNRRWSHYGPFVYAFTTPTLVIDVVNPQPICTGATLVAIERVRDSDPPPTQRRGGGAGGLLAAIVIVGVAIVMAKGS